MLRGKRLVLGITGGIAAYKAAELTRQFVKSGVEVQVIMTPAATEFITPLTFQALSGRPVLVNLWEGADHRGMEHIDFTRNADAILIAPASADFIAKLAQGQADDLLSTTCLARTIPLLVAPAMNQAMWHNRATQRNVAQLQADGICLLGPANGAQACGEQGLGRMLEPLELCTAVGAFFQPKYLQGQRVMLTAGGTFEPIDAVRGITNLSSGKMGYALAQACAEAGAQVTLVSSAALPTPANVSLRTVSRAEEMLAAVEAEIAQQDIFIAVAAVADYRVAQPHPEKIKKTTDELTLTLVKNPDILATIAQRTDAPFCVGFAAESHNLLAFAEEKRQRKRLPLLVANLAQQAFGHDENEVILLDANGQHPLARGAKLQLARQIVAHMATLKGLPPPDYSLITSPCRV